jgi:hypothetical protein
MAAGLRSQAGEHGNIDNESKVTGRSDDHGGVKDLRLTFVEARDPGRPALRSGLAASHSSSRSKRSKKTSHQGDILS